MYSYELLQISTYLDHGATNSTRSRRRASLPTRCAAGGGLPYQLDVQQEEVLNRPEETRADGAIAG
jgi:hypothetical protein